MRLRTALRIVAAIVVIKAVVIGIVWWRRYYLLRGHQPHVELGSLADWLAAFAVAGAAIAALVIAGREGRHRAREREDADHAQARLVQVEVVRVPGQVDFDVRIHNYGDRAIIGVVVTNAWVFGHPEYTWRHSDIDQTQEKIVKPDRDAPSGGSVFIQFLDGAGEFAPKQIGSDEQMAAVFQVVEPADADAVISFMDANGNLWETGSSIKPKRLSEASHRYVS